MKKYIDNWEDILMKVMMIGAILVLLVAIVGFVIEGLAGMVWFVYAFFMYIQAIIIYWFVSTICCLIYECIIHRARR